MNHEDTKIAKEREERKEREGNGISFELNFFSNSKLKTHNFILRVRDIML